MPNVLPDVPTSGLTQAHGDFMSTWELDPARPVILVPVRVFQVKGVEIAVALLAAVRRACARRGEPAPYLLVFGSLGEDPAYSVEVLDATERHEAGSDVRFLGGVPLGTHRDSAGNWRLDEVDLLRIAQATGGGVFFTPNRPDVESVGLGPALAAVAGLPCAATDFHAFDEIYGEDFRYVPVRPAEGLDVAGEQFAAWMAARRDGEPWFTAAAEFNRRRVAARFPAGPWRHLWHELLASEATAPA